MKQYLLLLKSGDFNKSGNTWTSNAINLYKNDSFTNYSYVRSRYGLNTIGDNIYVGLEYTSPSYTAELATPLSNSALYVTDIGEIVYEQATPSVLRFVDTTSKIDVLAYRHVFTNLPGTEVPTFNLQMHESDSADGPWLKSVLSFDSNIIFIRDCKPWIKIELEIFTETLNTNDLGLLFYLEVGVHDPVPAIASEHARNILKRFPTWTDMFADSENPATPSLFVPSSTAGKFLTALVQETLDNFDNELNLYDINHYISSADENMLAWAYVSYDVPVNILKVTGDDVPLVQMDSLASFYRCQSTDYVYYYSQANKQIISMREFSSLKINDTEYNQQPLHVPNNFDEFGARVGLPRLLLESNSRYKKRILDVSLNYPAAHTDGFKRTVRRELDIWKAYGLEPDSDYLGATPDVIEISDMEKSTPWFTPSGKPLKPFVDLIESINERYPSNIGYVRWEEGYWDYGGMDGEGISYIPAIYDVDTSSSPQYYQSGVGDYADAKLILEAEEKATTSFSGYVSISGIYEDGIEEVYAPIKVDYSWYLSYLKRVPDYAAGMTLQSWDQRGSDIDGEVAGDQSGYSVSLSSDGTILAIGGIFNDGSGSNAGHVRVYVWNGTSWNQRGSDIDGEVAGDTSGYSVSLSSDGTILAIGATGNDGSGSNAGHVRVYVWNGTSWNQRGSDIDGEAAGDLSGYSVSLSSDGTILAIGGIFNEGSGSSAGHVRVYRNTSSRIGVGLTYEIGVKAHANYATPSTFYSNLNYLNRDDFYVGNRFSENHPSSPEFNLIKIFNDDGYTVSTLQFKDKIYNNLYYNASSSPSVNTINFDDVDSVKIVFSNGGWNYVTQTYDKSLATANYRGGFSKSTPSTTYYTNPSYMQQVELASPSNYTYTDANIRIGSTVYETKLASFNTQTITSSFFLNESNNLTASGTQNYSMHIDDLVDRLILPPQATPQYLYIDNIKPIGLTYFNETSIINTLHGGAAINPDDNERYLVPSSPNIIYKTYNSSNAEIASPDYFDSATINYYATPSYLTFESASNNFYPIYFTKYSPFTSETTPQIFSGYIDSLDNVYESSEAADNLFFNSDDFLKRIYLSKDSFGLNSEINYIIKDIQLISDTQYIEPYVSDKNSSITNINNAFSNNEDIDIDVRIARDIQEVVQNNPAIHTGWLYLNQDEYYIYSNPITDSATGRFFSLPISRYPRSGSPIIVKVGEEEYRNILFEDAATPGNILFSNTEEIYGNVSNTIYLAYQNVENISVTDSYTGVVLFDNLSTSTNELNCFSAATPSVYGRKYNVSYDVRNAWYVDKNVYNPNTEIFSSSVYFSSTPNTDQVYSVTYESSLNDNSHSIDLSLLPSLNPLDEGFVYISKTDYNFASAKAVLSPGNISNLQDDLMYLTIVSYDENNNFKPGQTFHVYGDIVSATPAYVTTNDNGIAKTIIRYSYTGEEKYQSSNVFISGIGSATPYGNVNSQTQGYVTFVPFDINIADSEILRLKAAPSSLIINAGSDQSVSIVGQVLWNNQPWGKILRVSWNKARTLKDLFAATPDYTAYTSSDGKLEIASVATAQDSATPGYWFARVNIADEDYAKTILLADQEINAGQNVTISGDVIYWYESYDTVQYDQELSPPLPNIYTSNKQEKSDIIATPNFVYKHNDSNTIIYNSATPNWTPPRWVPLRKYDQYQMGIFGSTPNHIADYELVHPDHEEQ